MLMLGNDSEQSYGLLDWQLLLVEMAELQNRVLDITPS